MNHLHAIPAIQGLAAQSPLADNPLQLASSVYGALHSLGSVANPADKSQGMIKSVAVNAVMGALVLGTAGHLLPYFDVKSGAKWGALLGAGQALFTRMTS